MAEAASFKIEHNSSYSWFAFPFKMKSTRQATTVSASLCSIENPEDPQKDVLIYIIKLVCLRGSLLTSHA